MRLEPVLAERLAKRFQTPGPPATLMDLVNAVRERLQAQPESAKAIRALRTGPDVIGETTKQRGQSIVTADRGEVNVMCGYDAVATALLRGQGTVRATCFHCGEKMEIEIKDTTLAKASHPGIVFWLGDGPKGIPVCDHYNFFPDESHLRAWLETNPEELGVSLPLSDAVEFFRRSQDGL